MRSASHFLKELIKQDIVAFLFLCFLLGAGFIWLGSNFGWIHESDGEKINATVLWLTSLAIFWYAFETYQLKKSSASQAAIQEEVMLNEFLPILEPVARGGTAMLRGSGVSNLKVRNLGKGPAKCIEFYVGSIKANIEGTLAGGEVEALQLPADRRRQLSELLKNKPDTIRVRLKYQDIYNRKFETGQIVFDQAPRNGYRLRRVAGILNHSTLLKPKRLNNR